MKQEIRRAKIRKKKSSLKKYLIEFVLVFGAIVLGFFAENLREYYGDRVKEREFAALLVEDLRTDSINLNRSLHNCQSLVGIQDSILVSIKNDNYKPTQLLRDLRRSEFYGYLLAANTTIEQMKGAGALVYFRDKQLLDGILKHYTAMENLEDRTRWLYNYNYDYYEPFEVRHTNRMFLNFTRQDSIAFGKSPINKDHKPVKKFEYPLIDLDESESVQLYNLIWSFRLRLYLLTKILPSRVEETSALIQQLKKKYELK